MKIDYDTLVSIAEAAGIDEDDVRTDYSGRGMYGATCVGFDLDSQSQLANLTIGLMEVLGAAEAKKFAARLRTDGMGRGMVCYYPGITADAPEEEETPEELAQRAEELMTDAIQTEVEQTLVNCDSSPLTLEDFIADAITALQRLQAGEATP